MSDRNWKRIGDFDANEREVIAERLKYQTASELAAVFETVPQTISSIARGEADRLAHAEYSGKSPMRTSWWEAV